MKRMPLSMSRLTLAILDQKSTSFIGWIRPIGLIRVPRVEAVPRDLQERVFVDSCESFLNELSVLIADAKAGATRPLSVASTRWPNS
jgi:hypothetical protein